ncbi:hypothetical protein [Saccharopolyspora phatthalungensis]|uniref:Uncharacterized protein n=1 Tax=Saccharopolyspora phatthalungensis TaxID=664693 RepID=A0A840QCF3_9PSEU|nr:hypothetical protein [Saccharopolyspora phatthalungensis]MBB5158414.1 hypothetical protein [Saccharopolyspora phatthalungensis]
MVVVVPAAITTHDTSFPVIAVSADVVQIDGGEIALYFEVGAASRPVPRVHIGLSGLASWRVSAKPVNSPRRTNI